MRSEEQSAAKGRAPNTGMNAAPSSDYGSRVRSLLGMPPQQSAGPAFPPTLPPVGFRYAGQPHVATPPYGTEAVPVPRWRQVAAGPTAMRGEPGPDRGRVDADEGSAVSETVTPHVADAPRPGAERAATPEESDVRVDATSVQIPGASDEPRSFPTPSPATPGNALARPPEVRSQPGVPQMGLGETSAAPLRPEPQTAAAPETATSVAVRKAQPGAARRAVEETGGASALTRQREQPLSVEGKTAGGEAGVVAGDAVSPGAPLPPVGPEGRPGASPDARSSTVAARPLGPRAIHAADRRASERIEQLREAVRELSAKVATRAVATDQEPQPAQPPPPPPPPQPIVIVNRVSRQGRGPRAFWERRHLGHRRLRALR